MTDLLKSSLLLSLKAAGLYFKKITIEKRYLFGNVKNAKAPPSMDEFHQNGLE